MLAALQGGLYTSPSRPLPPASPMMTPANGAVPAGPSPRSRQQLQYCDACNTACMFMNSRRRKFQARYEGYVLLKRVAALNTRPHLPYVIADGDTPPYHRRHSCGDVLDEQGSQPADNSSPPPPPPPPPPPQLQLSVPKSPPISYSRSLSHGDWLRPEDDPIPTWEKVVNTDDSCQPDRRPTTPTDTVALAIEPPTVALDPAGRKPRRHSAMMERLACGHQRLCRKKSRSQDNLVGRRGSGGCGPLRLNNSIIPPPAALTTSLSRSEGSIHNVHAVLSTVPVTIDDGVGGLRAEVGELARLPKRLLHRVTGEVGQLVFDLEGWREEYLVLTHTAIAARSVSGHSILRSAEHWVST